MVILLINILNSFIKIYYVYWMEKILGIINVFFSTKIALPPVRLELTAFRL